MFRLKENHKHLSIQKLSFTLNNQFSSSVSIALVDRNLMSRNKLYKKYFEGDSIIFQNGMITKYIIEIQQNQKITSKNKLANNSPESYNKCIDQFIRSHLDSVGMENIIPLWATSDLDQVTTNQTSISRAAETEKMNEETGEIMRGLIKSDCNLPCLVTKSKSLLTDSIPLEKNMSTVYLKFSTDFEKIRESEVTLDSFTMFTLTIGNMGMWLGFSFFKVLYYCVLKVLKKILSHQHNYWIFRVSAKYHKYLVNMFYKLFC